MNGEKLLLAIGIVMTGFHIAVFIYGLVQAIRKEQQHGNT